MAIWIVLPILTLLMFDLGLTLRFEDFGQLVLLPLIALGLAYVFRPTNCLIFEIMSHRLKRLVCV